MTVRPNKALGQHFLVDENLLGVIGRLAELDSADVVLEIGPGLGVLTRFLAARAGHVHAVELDRGLDEPLREALAGHSNVRVTFGDALALDLSSLAPAPTKLVSNLPYNIATAFVLESLEHGDALERWCVMVQREVGERFFAAAGTRAYGAVSVLIQLQARRVGFRTVPPSAFRPRPRVDSALVAFVRTSRDLSAAVRLLVEAAFAHRRKTLANSVALAGLASRADAENALVTIGRSPRSRAQELEPREFVELAAELD